MEIISQSLPQAIQKAITAADEGNFQEAIKQANDLKGIFPVEVLAALAEFASRPSSLDDCLAASSARIGTDRLFSTWRLPSAQEWLGEKNGRRLLFEGNGIVRLGTGAELVTLGNQTAALRYTGLPRSGTYVVHLLASFPSNVGDNFYLSLEGEQDSEAIRFSNTNAALAADGAICSINGKVMKLYTLEVGKDHARLYVNGTLQKSKRRATAQSFETLMVKLIGEHGPDLSGFVHGFEIQHADRKTGSPFGDDKAVFVRRLQGLMARKDTSEIYHLLKGIDDAWQTEFDRQLLDMLDNQVSERGVQEWIYDLILGRVDPGLASAWVENHRDRLPAPILSVRDLSAEFMLTPNKRFSPGALLGGKGRERFMVLKDINFDIFPGDIVGIIGPNGAGKSTLLRAIAGLMPIHSGEIVLHAQHLLLSAGIGARNELTGRENIYLAGTFMGLSKSQIDALFDEIWEFSELGPAIDKPFKYYSDGMKGRLVFSLATSVSPQLLMLDELLSAGDIKFQKKAADRMEQLLDRAKAVVIVTHSMPFVAQRCNKALLVAGGRLAAYGDPKEVISHYLNILHLGDSPSDSDFNPLDMSIQQQQIGGFNIGAK